MQTNIKAIRYLALFHLLPWRATAVTNSIHYYNSKKKLAGTLITSLAFCEDEQVDIKDYINTESNILKNTVKAKLSEHKGSNFQESAVPNDIVWS